MSPSSRLTAQPAVASTPTAAVGARTCPGAILGMLSILAWTVAIAFAAQVRIPVPGTDVPMTLQALLALLAGYSLTPGRAIAAMLLYLGCGAAGLPVFAPHSAGLLGPTGGYLVGFIGAAGLVSLLSSAGRAHFGRLLLAGLAGMAVVFVCGTAWRLPFLGGNVALAVQSGVAPFALKAGVEVLLAATLVRTVRTCLPTRRKRTSRVDAYGA